MFNIGDKVKAIKDMKLVDKTIVAGTIGEVVGAEGVVGGDTWWKSFADFANHKNAVCLKFEGHKPFIACFNEVERV